MVEFEMKKPRGRDLIDHIRINRKSDRVYLKPKAARRGTNSGWHSKEARARRKGHHDARSGRLTPEVTLYFPTLEVASNACLDQWTIPDEEKMAKKNGSLPEGHDPEEVILQPDIVIEMQTELAQ